jgi:hypothetical protein
MSDFSFPQKVNYAFKVNSPKFPHFEMPPLENPIFQNIEENMAGAFYKRLKKWIESFDSQLKQEQEVGIQLVNFGQTVVFHLEGMRYCDPSMISFKGKLENGQPVELIQHVSQISILLTSLPRKNPNEPKKAIGFQSQNAEKL